jgi:hypothetical protein
MAVNRSTSNRSTSATICPNSSATGPYVSSAPASDDSTSYNVSPPWVSAYVKTMAWGSMASMELRRCRTTSVGWR